MHYALAINSIKHTPKTGFSDRIWRKKVKTLAKSSVLCQNNCMCNGQKKNTSKPEFKSKVFDELYESKELNEEQREDMRKGVLPLGKLIKKKLQKDTTYKETGSMIYTILLEFWRERAHTLRNPAPHVRLAYMKTMAENECNKIISKLIQDRTAEEKIEAQWGIDYCPPDENPDWYKYLLEMEKLYGGSFTENPSIEDNIKEYISFILYKKSEKKCEIEKSERNCEICFMHIYEKKTYKEISGTSYLNVSHSEVGNIIKDFENEQKLKKLIRNNLNYLNNPNDKNRAICYMFIHKFKVIRISEVVEIGRREVSEIINRFIANELYNIIISIFLSRTDQYICEQYFAHDRKFKEIAHNTRHEEKYIKEVIKYFEEEATRKIFKDVI